MKDHWHEIAKLEEQPDSKPKNIVLRAWDCLVYAIKKGFAFLKKHWKKILILVLLIGAFFLFKNSGAVTRLGDTLFGKGNTSKVWLSAKDKAKDLVKSLALPFGKKIASQWIPVDAADVDQVSVGVSDNGIWQSALKTTGEIVYGMHEDPNDDSSPMKWFKLSK